MSDPDHSDTDPRPGHQKPKTGTSEAQDLFAGQTCFPSHMELCPSWLLSPETEGRKDFPIPAVAGKGHISSRQPQWPAILFCIWPRKTQTLINNPWAGDDHCHSSITASLARPHTLPKHLGLLATARLDTSLGRLLLCPFIAGLKKWFKER